MKDSLKKIWLIFTAAERRKVLVMLVLVVMMAGVETLGVVSITPFLAVLGRPEVIQENSVLKATYSYFDFSDSRNFIIALGVASIALVISSSIFKIITQHQLNRFVHLQRHSLSARLLSRYLHQPYEYFLDRSSAVLSKNVLSEVDQLMFDLVQPISQLLAQGAVVVAMALLVVIYDPIIAVASVSILVLMYGLIYGVVRNRLARIGRERREANGRRYQACNEVLGGIKGVKVTQSALIYEEKFDQASRTFSRHTAANDTLNQAPLYFVEAVGYSGLIVVALVLLMRSGDVANVLPTLGLFGFAAYRMLPAAQVMYRGFARIKFSSASLDAIYHDMSLHEEIESSGESMSLTRELRLNGVWYAYPSSPSKPILKDLSLVVPVNTSVGIFGKSGVGKSTLMDMLLGLLQPQEGTITVDGCQINKKNIASWRRSVGYVPQNVYLSDASIKENIAFGVPVDKIDISAVKRAACVAQLHSFISNELEAGYDTSVGDRGVRLSGGQRQRLGIARALYFDPPILFFDEATSALDPETEEDFNCAIKKLSGEKTIVIISHKETSLAACTKIFVMGD
ncbi:MAG: ABC transporter ATP-binding protein [Haliea sp.]|nr:ABC transporter ATP-binding protein [Haliea sp.]|tara:strand:+ start:1088 stop:2794 length:1707 start_codon:yes stop_codon:yes gene_type:complete